MHDKLVEPEVRCDEAEAPLAPLTPLTPETRSACLAGVKWAS